MKPIALTAITTTILLTLSLSACASPSPNKHLNHRNTVKSVGVIKVLPAGNTVVRLRGVSYYTHAGVFYQPYQGGFRVVSAPVGKSVNILPTTYRAVRVNKKRYFVANGVYYKRAGNGFVVVQRPV